MAEECARIGAKALAEFLSIPLDSVKHNLLPDMKRDGVVLEWIMDRPPRKRLIWWPSVVIRYMALLQREKYAREHPEAKG